MVRRLLCAVAMHAVAVVALAAAPAPNLVANPGFETDAEADGQPDGWAVAGQGAHPDNWHCQRAKGKATRSPDAHAGRHSLLYVLPKPHDWRETPLGSLWDFAAWKRHREQPERRFYYAAPVVSSEFRITYPKVYRVTAWVKAQNVTGLHIKFIALSPKGQPHWFPPALYTPEGFTGKSGTWDWEKWERVIVANRGLGWKGRVEVWLRENMTDGRFWIDDVAVEEIDHAGRDALAPLRGAARSAPRPTAVAPPPHAPRKRQIVKTGNRLTISFANGTRAVFHTDSPGIGAVSVGGTPLRSGVAPVRPLVDTESGGHYTACRYVRWSQKDAEVTVHTQLIPTDGGAPDTLDWVLAPAQLKVGDRTYHGLRYSYRFASARGAALGIWDRASWEVGGEVDGLFVRGPGGARMAALARATAIQGRPTLALLNTPCFDFQAKSGVGLLLGFHDGIAHVETWHDKRPGENALRHLAHHHFAAARQVATAPRWVVFAPCGALDPLAREDEQTWALDVIENRYRQVVGLRDIPLLPTIRLHPHSVKGGKFADYIQHLPAVRKLGYEVAMLNPIWESLDRVGKPKPGTCSITGLEVAKAFGGEADLKKLADATHAQGMKLIAWAPTGLNRHDSALFRQHPDWICRRPDGSPNAYGGPSAYRTGRALLYVVFSGGYLRYSLDRYRSLRTTVGLDGFWQDSWHAAQQRHYTSPTHSVGNLLPAARRQAQLQRMGYQIFNIEGYGPFGNDSTSPKMLERGGRRLYKTSYWYYLALGPHSYYRAVANKAMPILPYHPSKHPYWGNRSVATNPAVAAEVVQANRDYAIVRSRMTQRELIPSAANPWQEIGVLWRDGQGKDDVLFAYGEFEWRPGADTRSVQDVTAGKPVGLSAGAFGTLPQHTYLIRRGR